jgi:hypothetical protein
MAAGRGAGEEKLASKSVISVTVILVTVHLIMLARNDGS